MAFVAAGTLYGPTEAEPAVINIPSHSSGDILVAWVGITQASTTPAASIDTPSGWTQQDQVEAGASSAVGLACFTKSGDGAETSVSFSVTGGSGVSIIVGQVQAFSGRTGTIEKVTWTQQETGTDIDTPTITPAEADGDISRGFVFDDDVGSEADHDSDGNWKGTSTGYGEIGTTGNSGNGLMFACSYHAGQPASASGTSTFSSNDSDAGVAGIINLRPTTGPTVSSVDSDDDTVDTRDPVLIAGASFGATDTGSAKVEITDNATYGSGSFEIEVPRNSWSATSISIALEESGTGNPLLDDLSVGTVYVYVTDSAGVRGDGFPFTLNVPGPTQFANVNTNASLEVDTTYLLRVRLENTGGVGGDSFRWAVNHNSGGDTPVTTGSSNVKAVNGTTFANDDDVPEIITGGGTYVSNNNAGSEDGTTVLAAVLGADNSFEAVLAFQIIGDDVNDAETGTIRLELNDGTDFGTYTQTFTYTVIKGGGGLTLAGIGGGLVGSGGLAGQRGGMAA